MYGLDSAQITEANQIKLDTIQLKGLRQICKIGTTWQGDHVEREYTNEYVDKRVEELCNGPYQRKMKIPKLSECYTKAKINRLVHIINKNQKIL